MRNGRRVGCAACKAVFDPATTKIGLANLVHNMRRLTWLEAHSPPA